MTVKYTESGLWIEELEDSTRIGLSVKGQDDLGDAMFIELPDFEDHIKPEDVLISVEGAKAVTEVVSPIAGSVKEVHKELEDDADLLNSDKRSDNWIIELTNVEGLNEVELSDEPWFGHEPDEE